MGGGGPPRGRAGIEVFFKLLVGSGHFDALFADLTAATAAEIDFAQARARRAGDGRNAYGRRGSLREVAAEALDEGQAIELGQHDVDDGAVIRGGGGQQLRLLAVRAAVHGKAILLQTLHDERSDFRIILDHQDSHSCSV